MKLQIIILSIIFSVFSTYAFGNNTEELIRGNSHTSFGEYELSGGDNYQVINNTAFRTWELKYPANGKTFMIYMTPGSNENCCFIIRGEGFEVQYSKSENGFGAKLVDNSLRTLSKRELMKQIDSNALKSQEVLTPNTLTVEEYLGMIACFMPMLFG